MTQHPIDHPGIHGHTDHAAAGPAVARPDTDRASAGRPAAGRAAWRRRLACACDDAGMATAEYAIVTVAAAGFAGLLLVILRSDEVRALLLGIVRSALAV